MKLVMTLVARDEADIIDAQIAYHLNAGVDFVVATDNGSQDSTVEILESYARDGYLHLSRDTGDLRQGEWVTRMARTAASDFGADWVINSDADGFWWPRSGSLKEILTSVPPRFGCVRAMVRHFVPRPDGDDFFAERMTVRLCYPGARSADPFSPCFQAVHRGNPEVVVSGGNHHAYGRGLRPLSGWYPIDMLHFPIRSERQYERSYLRWSDLGLRAGNEPAGSHRAAFREARLRGELSAFYESVVVDDAALAQGLGDGTLAVDTRVRDALRSLRAGDGSAREFDLPPAAEPLRFTESAVDKDYLTELGRLEEAGALAVAERRVEALEARLAALEAGLASRLRRRVSTRWRWTAAAVGRRFERTPR